MASRSVELASKINAYLKRFEADKSGVNKPYTDGGRKGLVPYYNAGAYAAGGRVLVIYVSYQGRTGLTIAEAEAYLAWLDAGNVGRHFEQQQASQPRNTT